MFKKIIAKIFGLHTKKDIKRITNEVIESRRKYYTKVLEQLQVNGSLPPNCDLKMPKQRLKITRVSEKGEDEVIAEKGRWNRLPMDNEIVIITYEHD
ncbi:hypothetical protein LCGC14_0896880 [marine sediment metagenome]|uniref:Uncharacterized protein n=1 Tax=marine sediment metagenome TaxID=412755 RepID=A0A0F9S4F3_9ZZZZ